MTTLDTGRPFTRADALAAGITDKQLRGPLFRRVFSGVYVDARVPDHPFLRCAAALCLHPPGAYASHFSAARIYRLPVPTHANEHVTVPRKKDRTQRSGIVCHVATATDAGVRNVGGVRLSAPEAMFVELAALLDLVELVVVGDALLRLNLVALQQLRDFCTASRGRHSARARRAAAYVRPRVESAMESRLRMLLVLAGLPEPEVNRELVDAYGNTLMRFDLSYPSIKLIVEYDGRQHAESSRQWLHDLKRRERLDEDQWRVLIVTSEGIYKNPAETVDRVHRALKERGFRPLPEPRSDAWRRFFPAR